MRLNPLFCSLEAVKKKKETVEAFQELYLIPPPSHVNKHYNGGLLQMGAHGEGAVESYFQQTFLIWSP